MMKNKPMLVVVMVISLLLGGLALNAIAAGGPSETKEVLRQGIMAGQQRAQTMLKAVAELTGLSQDEICVLRQEGKSFAAIAENEGVSPRDVIDKVAAERTAVLQKLKAENKITELQYEKCVTNMQEKIKTNMERTSAGPNKSGMGYAIEDGEKRNQGQGQGMGQGQGQGQGKGMGRGMGGNQGNCPYIQ